MTDGSLAAFALAVLIALTPIYVYAIALKLGKIAA